jgi:Ca-activated chloride channel family protein
MNGRISSSWLPDWQFGDPTMLWLALVPIGLALWLFFRKKRAPKDPLAFSSWSELLERERRRTRRNFRWLFAGFLLALVALTVGAARPHHVKAWAKRFSEGIDIVIVLDLSESMEADDLVPTRFIAAKRVISDFIAKRTDDRIGLVVFGGESVTKAPLTRDYAFLRDAVRDLRLRELKQGTAIGMGLTNGISRLRGSESRSKVLVLLTDGDNNVGAVNPVTASLLARQEGIKIYAIAMGAADRVVVPIYAYDESGRKTQLVAQVPSYLNPELMRRIAANTGGRAWMARDTGALQQVLQEIDRLEKTRVRLQPMQKKEELFTYPALLAFALLFVLVVLLETRFRWAPAPIAATAPRER